MDLNPSTRSSTFLLHHANPRDDQLHETTLGHSDGSPYAAAPLAGSTVLLLARSRRSINRSVLAQPLCPSNAR